MNHTSTQNNTDNIRPWGNYKILLENENCKVKQIIVKPNKRLSYQRHNFREEYWTIVQGEAIVTLNEKTLPLTEGDQIHIPQKANHRIANPEQKDLIFIEIQRGSYFGEDDIIRLEDDYDRK